MRMKMSYIQNVSMRWGPRAKKILIFNEIQVTTSLRRGGDSVPKLKWLVIGVVMMSQQNL
jgi:hypothetical protein